MTGLLRVNLGLILYCTVISLTESFYNISIPIDDREGDKIEYSTVDNGCHVWTTVEYTLTFSTFWSVHFFPKQYPTHRPNAQWSELLGRSHNDAYSLWREGRRASRELRHFLVAGDVTGLVQADTQGSAGVFDTFNTRPLRTGVAMATTRLLVNGRHTKVSAISRLIPSPDWFVGVDSLNTCVNGDWLNETEVNATLYDGGVDKGYVFTSPDFAEYPTKAIVQITASQPNHSASSFFYPHLDELPTIATLRLTKSRILVDFAEKKAALDLAAAMNNSNSNKNESNLTRNNTDTYVNNTHSAIDNFTGFNVSASWIESNNSLVTNNSAKATKTVTESTTAQTSDCVLGEWSAWLPCPVTCGYSTTHRTRAVIQHPVNPISGVDSGCSALNETKTCGSMRACRWSHFNSSIWASGAARSFLP